MEFLEKVEFHHHLGLNQYEMLKYLVELDHIVISKRTLKGSFRLLSYFDEKSIWICLRKFYSGKMETSDKLHGYKLMHLKCIQFGYTITQETVPQETVRLLLQIIDHLGVQLRCRGKLGRRIYTNPGPDVMWHIDSYDNLKPYGFCIN